MRSQMLGRPRVRGRVGENHPCDCRQCRGPGHTFRGHRRWVKKRERRQWKREVDRAAS